MNQERLPEMPQEIAIVRKGCAEAAADYLVLLAEDVDSLELSFLVP